MLAVINQSNATAAICHTLLAQHQTHGLHILRERGAVYLARMISPVRFSHLRIDGKLLKHRETKYVMFFSQIFGEARLPLASMNARHCPSLLPFLPLSSPYFILPSFNPSLL